MVLVALAIILVFWDTYRLQAAVALAALFAGGRHLVACSSCKREYRHQAAPAGGHRRRS